MIRNYGIHTYIICVQVVDLHRCIFCRKRLYQSVYEYDLPLFNSTPCRFEFVSPEESDLANPWKESFRQLYRGVHVRPGYQDMKFKGRNLCYFNTVQVYTD